MLNQISWANYFEAIAILAVIYYVAILFVYCKADILQLLAVKPQHSFVSNVNETGTLKNSSSNEHSDLATQFEYNIEELKALIRQSGYSQSPREEVLFALQKLLTTERFQSIYNSPFKDAVNNLISDECQTNCSIHLSEEDLQGLWVSK